MHVVATQAINCTTVAAAALETTTLVRSCLTTAAAGTITLIHHTHSSAIGVEEGTRVQDRAARLRSARIRLPWRCWVSRRLSALHRLRELRDIWALIIRVRYILTTGSRSARCSASSSSSNRVGLLNSITAFRPRGNTIGRHSSTVSSSSTTTSTSNKASLNNNNSSSSKVDPLNSNTAVRPISNTTGHPSSMAAKVRADSRLE